MKTKMNLARGGVSASKKLLAAIAVLAVAFAVFAAIPVAVDDSDAAIADGDVAKIGDTGYATLDAAIADSQKEGVTSDTTITLLKDCTIDKDITLTKSVTFDGTSAKYTITLNKDLLVKGDGITVTFNNLNIRNTDVKGDKDDSSDSNGILVEAGFIVMENVEFTGAHSVEYGTTIRSGATAGTFTNVDFNDKILGMNSTTATVTLTKCSDVRINYPNSGETLKIGEKLVIDDDTAKTTTLNFAAVSGAITLDLKGKTIQFENITERYGTSAGTNNLTITNGTLKDTTFSVYHGDEDDYKAEKGYYRSSVIVFGDKLTLAGTTNVKVQQDRFSSSDFVVPAGKTVTISGEATFVKNASIDFGTNTKIGALTINSSDGKSSIAFNGASTTKGMKIADGSVILSGDIVTDASTGNITVTGNAKIEGELQLGSNTLTVNDGAKLTVEGKITGNVTNNGEIVTGTGADITGATINGDGQITNNADDSEMSEVTVGGISDVGKTVFSAKNVVTVNKSWTLIDGSDVIINGKLVIPEGATLTIQSGAKLTIDNNAVFEIEGTLVIEEAEEGAPAEWGLIVKMGEVRISNNVTVNGPVAVEEYGKLTIGQDGTLIIGTEGSLKTIAGFKVTVDASGTLQVNGSLGATAIENAGTVIFDSMVASENVTIKMKNGGAVDVKNLTLKEDGTVTIEDEQNDIILKADTVTLKKIKGEDGTETDVVLPNGAYAAAVISGVTITEQVTSSKNTGGEIVYTYVMDISGNAAVDYVYVAAGDENEPEVDKVAASITLNGSSEGKNGITVTGALTVGENVTLNNAGKLTVSATIDASKGKFTNKGTVTSGEASSERMGTLTVTREGKVIVKALITDGTVNAARYVTTSDKLYNYVTLDAALAAANAGTTKDIAVLGQQALTASATLPKDVKLDLKEAIVAIGEDVKATGVTLTVASGASVKNAPASIDVYGTVYSEKKTDIDSAVREKLTAGADVYSEELNEKGQAVRDGWAKWTNIATALVEAPEGSVVKITKDLTIKTDLTIPEKVTLDTNGKNVTVFPGVTITDNGTLSITNNDNKFVMSNDVMDGQVVKKKAAAFVLNGEIASNGEIKFLKGTYAKDSSGNESVTATEEGFVVGAAYYSITTKNVTKYYATTVEKAAPLISTVDEQKITLKGAELTVGDVSFEGMSAEEPLATVVVEAKKLTVSSITLANAKIEFTGGQTFQGTIKDAAGSIVLKGKAGTATTTTDGTTEPVFAVESGKAFVVIGDFNGEEDPVVFSGAVSVKAGTIDNAKVEGTLTVADDAEITTIVVNGAVSIDAGKTLTTTTAEVFGTIVGASETGATTGALNVAVMYIGIAAKDIIVSTGATASVTGNVTLSNYALVAPGTTVPEAFTEDGVKTTAFYIGDNLYLTAYAGTAVAGEIAMVDAHIENARFDGWYNDKNEKAVVSSSSGTTPAVEGQKFGATGFEKVTAKVVYDIYKIVLKADEGIADVYLNGQAMYYGLVNGTNGYYYAYTATVSAGDYKVTYTLKNGWSGEAKLTGENVTGTSFKATGTPANGQDSIPLVYQLSGVEKSGYVEPVTPSEDNGDDGLTITDYLLIVLVVLIVIMAVIVAMRLMRS